MSFGRALGTAVFLSGLFMVWLAFHLGERRHEERLTAWNEFVKRHACKVEERRETPSETGFLCGVIYWKRGTL